MCSIAHAASFPRQSNRSACHPTEPIPTGMANGRCGAWAGVAVDRGERPLLARSGDLRRDGSQGARGADSRPSCPHREMERFDPEPTFIAWPGAGGSTRKRPFGYARRAVELSRHSARLS